MILGKNIMVIFKKGLLSKIVELFINLYKETVNNGQRIHRALNYMYAKLPDM